MTQLLFFESFVLGAATIAAIYHLVLYIQQRDKFLMYYSLYLFSLASYISFKLISNNYDPFAPTDNVWYYILEEVIQVGMVTVYVVFAAQTLEVVKEKSIVRTLMFIFFIFSFISIVYHVYGAYLHGPGIKLKTDYALSRISLVGIATLALLFAWRIRTTIFQRTIIIGSLVYDTSGLLSIISFTQDTSILGLSGVEPYLLGCLLDIIIFSSALGYRLKTIADQKNELLKKEIDARLAIEKTRTRIAINLHDDVGSVLSSMSVYGEAAQRSIKENNLSKASELIDKIGVNARETMSNMSDIVWTINPMNDSGEKLFDKMEAFATSLFNAKEIEFNYRVDENLLHTTFPMPIRQNIYFIFKEIINNCIKHANASIVNAEIIISGSNFIMTISDNGSGFDVTKMNNGNGLKNMQQRAAELSGNIDIVSTHSGTQTVLSFSINQSLIN